jgi:LmbE family N-acetylglucosaminyl deacetylase
LTHRIALVFAHPDDETFCVGGIVAKYAAAGVRVDLFCATNGDAGKTAGVPVSSREQLAEIRQRETREAARILGIASVEFGGYGDGTLNTIDPTPLIGDVVSFIRRTRPTVVLAFGPEGAPTGHRDHRALSRASMAAFFLSGLRTAYPEQIAAGLEPHRAARLFFHAWDYPLPDPRLVVEPVPPTVGIDVRVFLDRKLQAFRAHATQQLSYEAFKTSHVDVERLAFAAGISQPRAIMDDLFEGL